MDDRVVPAPAVPAVPRRGSLWGRLGPGLITGAADDDPSGIATYSQGGAQFGNAVAWTVLVTYPLMFGIQLASARIGRVTGRGLAENFERRFPRWLVVGLVGLLVVANVINLGADLNAMGDVSAILFGGQRAWFTIGYGVTSLLLQVFLPYARYVSILKWLTLSLLAYLGVGLVVHMDFLATVESIFWPHVTWSREYITTVVAIFGTTISPYLFFWQAAQEVEEIHRVKADRPLRIAPEQIATQYRRIKLDTAVGMGFSNLVALFIILATAATLHAHGITDLQTTTEAALALRPVAGNAAFLLFATGIVGTGLLALPVLAGSAAYATASLLRFRTGLNRTLVSGGPFYAVIAVAILVGLVIAVRETNPISALYWSAVINAVLSVPIMVAVMVVATSPRIMGGLTLTRKWRVLGWGATLAMAVATVAMFWTLLPA